MFGVLPQGVRISESFSDFEEPTLLQPSPIPCWPSTLGSLSAGVIRGQGARSKVLVTSQGAGGITLELLRGCSHLEVVHVSPGLADMAQLLSTGQLDWEQPLEGRITEQREFRLTQEERGEGALLSAKHNTVQWIRAQLDDYSASNSVFQVVVADIRSSNSGDTIRKLGDLLDTGGCLILGSIDDVDDQSSSPKHSGGVLSRYFDRVPCVDNEASYPHIYKETRNKHQFAISYFSVWRKKTDQTKALCATSEAGDDVRDAVEYYENDKILNSYDLFHFGEGLLSVKNFPLRMAEVCLEACDKYKARLELALDAGAGPGRTAMELCNKFKQVCAYDYSHGFVENMLAKAKTAGLTNLEGRQGDSHAQAEMYPGRKFDLIFGCNLIDRLHTPLLWVQQSKEMLSDSGLLVISSPYTWKPEHTAPDLWLGGRVKEGRPLFTQDGLESLLGPDLVLLEAKKVPFVIPDSDGTFQYTYSNCTIFGRRK